MTPSLWWTPGQITAISTLWSVLSLQFAVLTLYFMG